MSMVGPALRVGFAGTPEFAAVALRAVLEAGFTVPLVLSQPDRPAGRGMKLQASAVKTVALSHAVPVAQPRSLRLDGKFPDDARQAQAELAAADLDVLVVAAYGLILPQWVLDLPRRGCLNIHGSLLPRWRGAAPIHRAIEAGDALTGITLMQMDAGLDTGGMIDVVTEPVRPDDTTASLHDRLAALGAQRLVAVLQQASSHPWHSTPQPLEGVCYAHKIDKTEATIDWSDPADVIARRVRAFDPFPGAHFSWAGETVKVWRAQAHPAPAGTRPGTVLALGEDLLVCCGEGVLALQQVQRPGGKRQAVAPWCAANALGVGSVLG
jgi:methionyl-tRNA formyltransferase